MRIERLQAATRVASALLTGAVILGGAPPAFAAAVNPPPSGVSFTLSGCKLPTTNGTPDYTLPLNGLVICQDQTWDGSNDDYTTGNLGKSWNELDLVPYRVVVDAGNSAPASSSFTFAIVLDYLDNGKPGYDVISAPTRNPGSSASCPAPVVSEPQSLAIPGLGGIDQSVYRTVTLNGVQDNTKCVYDFYGRLALGSHLFPGSSLHGNLALVDPSAPGGITTSGIGARDVSIPVKEISPQELRSSLTASQGTSYRWEITKEASPGSLSWSNTCNANPPLCNDDVTITVRWKRLSADPSGPITLVAQVYAKNPASRVITVNVSNTIYKGTTQANALDTESSGDVDVPANTELLVMTHTFEWTTPDVGVTQFNSVATATYTDKITGVPVPGSTQATASATLQYNGTVENTTATVTDVETLTGVECGGEGGESSGCVDFSADSAVGDGAFDFDYVPGTPTTGPVSWTSNTQSGDGEVTFKKTVCVDAGTTVDATLTDTATLTGSDGFTDNTTVGIEIDAAAKVELTINKTIPDVLRDDETATFTFYVCTSEPCDAQTPGVVTVEIAFAANQTTGQEVLKNLDPGTYYVTEAPPEDWNDRPGQTATIALPSCSGSVSFENEFTPATAKALKETDPAGFGQGFTFTLTGPGIPGGSSVQTDASGTALFGDSLQEGEYTITETDRPGWIPDGETSCTFTVDYPADAGATKTCSFSNRYVPQFRITKTGDDKSKIGDAVSYTIKLYNDGAPGDPPLQCSVADPTVGLNELSFPLEPGAYREWIVPFPIPADATDPFVNTVTATCSAGTASNTLDASWTTELFQPSITFDKSADTTLSKVGDKVKYTLTLGNTSSSDTPELVCTVTDALLGVNKQVSLASGAANDVTNVEYTIPAGAPDPLNNTASVSCSPTGFPNVLTASDSWSVNLFQPSVDVVKTGPPFSKAGDAATYTVTITNTSSADSPNLELVSFADSLVPGVTPPAPCNLLAPGASCTFPYSYLVLAGDPDPLVNTATVHYRPVGFANDITDSGSWTTDLLHPAFNVAKVCKAEPISQAGPAVFRITFNNTGDADLYVVPSEGDPFPVAAGGTVSYDHSIDGPFTASVPNTVTGAVSLAARYLLANSYTFEASDTCDVKGKVLVEKTVSGQPPASGQVFTFELRQGASPSADGTVLETKNTDASGDIAFSTELSPGQTYQICEQVMPGWNTNLAGDGALFVPSSIIPPSLPNPNVNNLTVCADFKVTSGQTRTFTVDNSPPPGGRALTIGFWKNWASCAGSKGGQKPMLDLALAYASQVTTNPPGGMVVSAQNPGSLWPNYAATWYLILKGDPTSTIDLIKPAPDCAKAVNLLDKRTTGGTKKASDPLFNMTAQLVAAEANRFMGAGINGTTIMNVDRAVLLNGKYKFNGLTYSPKLTTADTNLANCLATQLDNYNNNRPVSSCP